MRSPSAKADGNETLMTDKRYFKWEITLLLMLIASMAIFGIYFYSERDKPSYICEYHKHFYLAELLSGRVIEKYIDKENHAIKTVFIKDNVKIFRILMISDSNINDYEKLKVGDIINKSPKALTLKVNNKYQFKLDIDCKY